jgi:hypothetical protein
MLAAFVTGSYTTSEILLAIGTNIVAAGLVLALLRIFMADTEEVVFLAAQELATTGALEGGPKLLLRSIHGFSDAVSMIAKARRVDLMGYTLDGLLAEAQKSIIDCLRRGGRIRILLVGKDTGADALMRQHSAHPQTTHHVAGSIGILDAVRSAVGVDVSARLEARQVDWIRSCGLCLIYDRNRDRVPAYGRIEIYPPDYRSSPGDRPVFVLHGDTEWSRYYAGQFQSLWERGEVLTPPTTRPALR